MSSKYELDSRDPVSPEFAFETFSKAGFKSISAICEIIDNSIEANANELIIKFEWRTQTSSQSYRRVGKIIFIDDGDGMDDRRIYDYFVATESDKRDNPTGIGKFGVGAYLSCISQANVGEVYSKIKGGKWVYTNLTKGGKIPKPIVKDPPKEYLKFDQGTIVIWNDTYSKFTDNDIEGDTGENLVHELGRIYRKFISNEKIVPTKKGTTIQHNDKIVKIKIDNSLGKIIDVLPYDPLYLTYNPKLDDKEKPTQISQRVPLTTEDGKGWMVITYSKFPDSWWEKYKRPGNEPVNLNERKITRRNEGISLVREGRELYFGPYPGGPIKIKNASDSPQNRDYFDVVDRWTGIEIEFSKESDDIFGVEFNKTRILMNAYPRKMISDTISGTVVERRKYFTRKHKAYEEKTGQTGTKSGKKSTSAIHDSITKPDYSSEQQKRLKEFAERFKDDLESTEDVYNDLLNGYHVSLGYGLDPDGPFVQFGFEGSSVLVKYNMQHPFMNRFFEMLEELGLKLGAESGKAGSIEEIQSIRSLLDILMASFAFARQTFPDVSDSQEIKSTITHIINNWGTSAEKLARHVLEKE